MLFQIKCYPSSQGVIQSPTKKLLNNLEFGHRFCQPNGEANKNKNNFIMKFLDLIAFSALASVICQEKNIISFISTDFVLR